MWNPKRFWREYPQVNWNLFFQDVKSHSSRMLRSVPARKVGDLDEKIQALVGHLMEYKQQFEHTRDTDLQQEWSKFWLRKSFQPVLCVVLTEKDGVTRFTRGVNLEVEDMK